MNSPHPHMFKKQNGICNKQNGIWGIHGIATTINVLKTTLIYIPKKIRSVCNKFMILFRRISEFSNAEIK
jgi:hypothetical protein